MVFEPHKKSNHELNDEEIRNSQDHLIESRNHLETKQQIEQ